MNLRTDLTPLPKGDVSIGEPLKYPIYDGEGNLLLAAGQVISSNKQLDDLGSKGLFHNPRWSDMLVASRKLAGTVAPSSGSHSELIKKPASRPQAQDDPSQSGRSVKMSLVGTEEAFMVNLVGEIRRDAFVVTHPTTLDGLVFVREGQTWEFRSFYGINVYRFTATVQKVLLTPYAMVILSWPHTSSMEKKAIRNARRATCELPATLKHRDVTQEEVLSQGLLTNISTGGGELLSSSKNGLVQEGMELRLIFQLVLADKKSVVQVHCKVMSSAVEGDFIRHGLAFQELSEFNRIQIHAYVLERVILKTHSALYD